MTTKRALNRAKHKIRCKILIFSSKRAKWTILQARVELRPDNRPHPHAEGGKAISMNFKRDHEERERKRPRAFLFIIVEFWNYLFHFPPSLPRSLLSLFFADLFCPRISSSRWHPRRRFFLAGRLGHLKEGVCRWEIRISEVSICQIFLGISRALWILIYIYFKSIIYLMSIS